MKPTLLITAALLLATPAWPCDVDIHECVGKVTSSPGHVAIETKVGYCFIHNKLIIKRLLKICPEGSRVRGSSRQQGISGL